MPVALTPMARRVHLSRSMTSAISLSGSGTQSSQKAFPNQAGHKLHSFLVTVKASDLVQCKPLALRKSIPQLRVIEDRDQYTILVPLKGIDLRQVFILAAPRSLLIEVRVREILQDQGNDLIEAEVENQRISRELTLRHPIRRGRTAVDTVGGLLRITSLKAPEATEDHWSDLVHFDTRASLGPVYSANEKPRMQQLA